MLSEASADTEPPRDEGEGFLRGKYPVKMRGLKERQKELCSPCSKETNGEEGLMTLRDYIEPSDK